MNLYLDIETVPYDDSISEKDLRNALPKTVKKEETIAKKIVDEKEALEKAILKQRSLSHYECKIVCLSYSFDGEKPQSITGTEKLILQRFQDIILKVLAENRGGFNSSLGCLTLIGHNIKDFDAPIIFLRSVKYNHKELHQLFFDARKDRKITDTMEMGVFYSYGKRVSLDNICKFLDVPTPKDEMDGSKVYAAYKEGRIEDIALYCNKDVESLIAVHQKLDV